MTWNQKNGFVVTSLMNVPFAQSADNGITFSFRSFVIFFDEAEESEGDAGQEHQQVQDDGEVRGGGGDVREQEVEHDAEPVDHLNRKNLKFI